MRFLHLSGGGMHCKRPTKNVRGRIMTEEQLRLLLYIVRRLQDKNSPCSICDCYSNSYSPNKLCSCIEHKLVEMVDEFNISSSDL